jgi:cellulose synthase/poly-beta-1,6-N-acetylglucosamine synthase-like glycosyltransferase
MENLEPISNSSGVEAENFSAQTEILGQNSLTSQKQLLIYLIPVIGVLPSLWTLYGRQGSREQMKVSRLSITMAFTWLLAYLLLATGAATAEFFALRLLILNSFLTSGYFLVSIWLMFRIIQGQSSRLPGLSNLAERVLGKY